MNPYLSITFRTFTIWIMAAVINGLLCGICMSVSDTAYEPVITIIFCGIFSLFFSIPGFFIFWIVMLIAIGRYTYGRALFRVGLSAGLVLSAATAVMCVQFFIYLSPNIQYVIPVFIIFSAITSIMMHFNLFKKIGIEKQHINKI